MVRAIKILILCLLTVSGFAQVVQERNARGADRIIILKDGFRVPIRDTATAPALLNYSGDSSRGGVVYDSTLQKLCFWTGVRWVCLDDAAGPGGSGVDSIYRKPGQDSIFYTINSIERAIKDSVGGGGSGVPSDSLAWRRAGITQPINTIGWMNTYNGTVGASASGNAVDSANLIWGARAGQSLTTGYRNIALGRGALKSATTAFSNIAIGDSALSSVGVNNVNSIVAIGVNALRSYTFGTTTFQNAFSLAIGSGALENYTGSTANTAVGHFALRAATTGNANTAFGNQALVANTTGASNLAIGYLAGNALTTGNQNTIINNSAPGITTTSNNTILGYNVRTFSGSNNLFVGSSSENAFTQGSETTVIGALTAGRSTGNRFVAIGVSALATTPGNVAPNPEDSSVAIGYFAGSRLDGAVNVGRTNRGAGIYIGYQAAMNGTADNASTHIGNELIAIGVRAALTQSSGDYNMALGRVNLANTTGSNQLAIGGNGIGWIRQDVDGSLRRTLLNATTADVTTFTPSTALEINGTNGAVLLPRLTTAQRDALTPTDGMQIYNTTTNKFQGRAGGAWVDLH